MSKKSKSKQFGTFTTNGVQYYRTRIRDQDGKRITLYAKTVDELCEKVEDAKHRIENKTFCRTTPTVKEYCEKWLLLKQRDISPERQQPVPNRRSVRIAVPFLNCRRDTATMQRFIRPLALLWVIPNMSAKTAVTPIRVTMWIELLTSITRTLP